jgi:hypothetical protein
VDSEDSQGGQSTHLVLRLQRCKLFYYRGKDEDEEGGCRCEGAHLDFSEDCVTLQTPPARSRPDASVVHLVSPAAHNGPSLGALCRIPDPTKPTGSGSRLSSPHRCQASGRPPRDSPDPLPQSPPNLSPLCSSAGYEPPHRIRLESIPRCKVVFGILAGVETLS